MLSLASSTFRLAATALTRLQQQQQQSEQWQTELASLAHLPEYSLQQVSWHDRPDDCWIVLNDKVYNVTKLVDAHPGGMEVMMEQAGRDATSAFRSVGHSIDAIEQVDEFLVKRSACTCDPANDHEILSSAFRTHKIFEKLIISCHVLFTSI
jgi:cytochrome b involved in lipid metabolism